MREQHRAVASGEVATDWKETGSYQDIRHDIADGVAKITICRPEVRNAFRPQTLFELEKAFEDVA